MSGLSYKKSNNKRYEEGFTLPMVMVMLVVAAMIGATLFQKSQRDEYWNPKVDTHQQLERFAEVLASYQRQHKVLPCPASRTVAITDAAHGVANCSLASPAVVTSSGVLIGAIPYKALNLSVDHSGDAWGNKITYAVTQTLTNSGTYMASNGTIRIQTPAGLISTEAAFVLVSHGVDAKGAFRNNIAGTTPLVACGTAAGGTDFENCNNNNTFFSGQLNRTPGANYYDDHLVWRPVDYTAKNM